jgi:hypothetical protein
MASVNTHQNFDIRVYDGETTPNYIDVTFYDFPTLPGQAPIPPTTVVLGGGKAVAGNVATIIEDETSIFNPVDFTLRFRLESEKIWQLDAFGNPRRLATWNVGTGPTVWVPVAVANIGTRRNSSGTAIAAPGPKHTDHVNSLFNLEVRNSVPADAPSGVVFVHRLLGCVVNDFTHEATQGGIYFNLTCQCFGQIDTQAAAFTAGTETT